VSVSDGGVKLVMHRIRIFHRPSVRRADGASWWSGGSKNVGDQDSATPSPGPLSISFWPARQGLLHGRSSTGLDWPRHHAHGWIRQSERAFVPPLSGTPTSGSGR
jgi:hypothetical protein